MYKSSKHGGMTSYLVLFVSQPIHKSHCTFKEEEVSINGEALFQYGVTFPPPTGNNQNTARTFYLGFRKNGKKLRGSEWPTNSRFQQCLHFIKEHDRHSHLMAPQDPYAPDVDLDRHWNIRHSLSREHANNRLESNAHALGQPPQERRNHNAQWAPTLRNNQNPVSSSSQLVNRNDGHAIRHSRRQHRNRNTWSRVWHIVMTSYENYQLHFCPFVDPTTLLPRNAFISGVCL